MKKREFQEWRNKSEEEIRDQLRKNREELFNLRYQNTLNQLTNKSAIRNTRKDIARMEFLLGEMKRNANA